MQSELPWNVAGIPAEAREAARAAARREGLSVGEWMTRRILTGFPEATRDANDNWRPAVQEPLRRPTTSSRDSQEMLAHISRGEAESQHAFKVIDEQLRAVAQRLEAAERNQTENSRAVCQTANQINVAARDQAEAFERMNGTVASLAQRLARLERNAQTDGIREAIKALHLGLSRVADQIGHTATQSASQIAALAGNMESLAGQVVAAGDKADAAAQAVKMHLASLDERVRVVERTACSTAAALDHTMENLQQLKAEKDDVQDQLRQQASALSDVQQTAEQLNGRIDAGEERGARLQEEFAQLQAKSDTDPLDRRLSGIEHVLSDIMGRLEQSEHTNPNASIEQSLRDLASGFEAADDRNRETILELQNAVHETADKIAAVEQTLLQQRTESAAPSDSNALGAESITPAERVNEHPTPAVETFEPRAPEPLPAVPQMILDAPPFPEDLGFPAESEVPPPFPSEPALHRVEDEGNLSPVFAVDAATPPSTEPSPESGPEVLDAPVSFLEAARRSAKAAAAEREDLAANTRSMAWKLPGRPNAAAESDNPKRRYVLAGSIFGVAVAAALTGVVLSHGSGSVAPPATPVHQEHKVVVSPARTVPPLTQTHAAMTPRIPAASPGDVTPRLANTEPSSPATPVQKLASLAKTGDAKAQLLLGLDYLEGRGTTVDEAEAARWLSRAAQQGEPLAQYRLGTLYERGRGVSGSAQQAAHWYELAAKQGNRKAMHNLAIAFAQGVGEPKDPVQAAMWFARAANLGLADSQFNLAVLYERGMGVKQSLVDAYKWYLIAAAQGDAESKSRAEALMTQLGDADRAAAQQAATSFRPQPLNEGANSAPTLG